MNDALKYFFDSRSSLVTDLSMQQLCYASGRDARLWSTEMYEDLLNSVCEQLSLDSKCTLLEVGCAAGFLARGLSGHCKSYTGIDIAPSAVAASRRLNLQNASFQVADATTLPFGDNSFDRVISYDVFTNFSDFSFAEKVMAEMVRVIKPGGSAMVGSLADKEKEKEQVSVIKEVGALLDEKYGPQILLDETGGSWLHRLKRWYVKNVLKVTPAITCYSFIKKDFQDFGAKMSVSTEIVDIHPMNPYRKLRFNVIYHKL